MVEKVTVQHVLYLAELSSVSCSILIGQIIRSYFKLLQSIRSNHSQFTDDQVKIYHAVSLSDTESTDTASIPTI